MPYHEIGGLTSSLWDQVDLTPIHWGNIKNDIDRWFFFLISLLNIKCNALTVEQQQKIYIKFQWIFFLCIQWKQFCLSVSVSINLWINQLIHCLSIHFSEVQLASTMSRFAPRPPVCWVVLDVVPFWRLSSKTLVNMATRVFCQLVEFHSTQFGSQGSNW